MYVDITSQTLQANILTAILDNVYSNSVILEGQLSSAKQQDAKNGTKISNNYGKLQSAFNNFQI